MNAVLIILDSLRPDHVGCYGNEWIKTPNLDALAKESVLFTHAYPESLPTLPARRAIYTGCRIFPFEEYHSYRGDFIGAPGWEPMREDRDSLAEILILHNYRTGLISDVYHQFKPSKNFHRGFSQWTWIRGQELDPYRSGPQVSEEEIQKHIPENIRNPMFISFFLRHYLTNVQHRNSEKDYFAPQVFRTAATWLEQNQDSNQIFLTVESFDPHEPWDPPVHYRRLYDEDDNVRDVITSLYGPADQLTPGELKRLRANYAGEVTMTDQWLGHFLQTMRRLGLMDSTVLIVVSDHGHCLGEQGLVSKQGYPLCREVADLAMMIRFPDGTGAGTVCDKFAYHHDIPVTILRALDIDPPKSMEGQNLKPLITEDLVYYDHITTGWGPFVMVRDRKYWYNAYLWGNRPLLYDLEADPQLRHNIAADLPDVCQKMAELALRDAKGVIPDYLREMADKNIPGCTPMKTSLTVD